MQRSAVLSSKAGDITSTADETLQFDDDPLGGEGQCALFFPWYNVNSREVRFNKVKAFFPFS